MPAEVGYNQQVGTARPAALPDASAAAFGAGIGAAIADAGETVHQAKIQAYRADRRLAADQAWGDFATRFADTRSQLDRARADARVNAQPGGAGHTEQMEKAFDAATANLADTLTEDDQRARAREMIASYRQQVTDDAYTWQLGEGVKKSVADIGSLSDKGSARLYTSGDPASYVQETKMLRDSIDGLTNVPVDVRDRLFREGSEKLAVAYGNHLIDTNPKLASAAIDAGVFNDVLDGQQLDRLHNGARAQIHAQEAQARAQAATDKAAARDELEAQAVTLDAGGGTYQDRLNQAQRYEQMGDRSKAAQWHAKAQQFITRQAVIDWDLPQLDRRISTLQGKQNGGGLSGEEANELAALQDERASTAKRLNQDGGALLQWQYANRRPVVPLNPADPASMQQRARDATIAAQRYGRASIEPILPNELPAFKDLMANGPNGKLQVLDQIRGFGNAQAIAGAARQVAGDDGAFRVAALLPRDVARDVIRGNDTLKAHPQVWNTARATADFAKWYGNALGWVGGSYRNDIMDAAKSFYSQRASDGGVQQYDPGRFAQAIETVMGRSSDGRGGVARTSQGIVIVPSSMKPDQLLQTFARATPQDYGKAAGGRYPVWTDGKGLTEREFKGLLPTMVADGVYGFRGRNGQLIHDNKGDAYTVPIAKLPHR
ncbi:hypothetical protein [Sphingomonas sp. GV3]|uniref:hypothetical protein n=1 Tax=Sphingomonas sp. GV3 TaxID=3040671 RepID=UPI00280C17A2|nr:hypothetical protein [Sphingomonas sp. GV3]